MKRYVIASTTLETRDDAVALSRRLVESGAAACVQIVGPIESVYQWKDRVEDAQEWLCLIKTTMRGFETIESIVETEHPYELPELVVLPIEGGSESYLNWLSSCIG
jgi:periplasmic divalent cation tolerance protein